MARPLTSYARPGGLAARDGQLRLMAKVARMYHERGMRQSDIAAELHVSQPRVSRLHKRAVEIGVVRTIVALPAGVHADLEESLEERFGLVEAVVVDVEGEEADVVPALGAAAASYLETRAGSWPSTTRRRDVTKRSYESETIRVGWNAALCIHSALCLKGLPGVFDVDRRPWVDADSAGAEEIARVIERCPSGALTYERLDGGPAEQVAEPTSLVPWPNGPLLVRGDVEVRDSRGEVFERLPRMTLCRCGRSGNQPFCDLSRRKTGFRSVPRALEAEREQAECPADVSDIVGP